MKCYQNAHKLNSTLWFNLWECLVITSQLIYCCHQSFCDTKNLIRPGILKVWQLFMSHSSSLQGEISWSTLHHTFLDLTFWSQHVWLNPVCEDACLSLCQIEVILTIKSEAIIPSTMAQKQATMTPTLMKIIEDTSLKRSEGRKAQRRVTRHDLVKQK